MLCSPSAADGGARQREDIVEIETPYCEICKLPMNTMYQLLRHLKSAAHIKKAAEAALLQSQSLQYDEWICDTCHETFQTEDSLTIHQLTECKKD